MEHVLGMNTHTAIMEAMAIEHGGAEAVKLGYGEIWAVESQSEPDTFHFCIRLRGNTWVCSCKGFRFTDNCRHVKLMDEEVAKRPDLFPDMSEL